MLKNVLKYRPANVKVFNNIGYVVEFYVYDLQQGKMVRQILKLNRHLKPYKSKRDKQRAAEEIAAQITIKLSNGWSPLNESESPRILTSIKDLRDKYITAKKREGLRPMTLQSYTSITKIFIDYLEENNIHTPSGYLSQEDAIKYMDHVQERGLSNRAYNNTLKQLQAFFNWAVTHCYCKQNPFANIPLLSKECKKRILIDEQTRTRIASYLSEKCPQFLLYLNLIYSAMIRPAEARSIRLSWIDIERHCIVIPANTAKNGKARCAAITRAIEAMLMKHANNLHPNYYLFGKGQTMMPNEIPCAQSTPRHKWDRLREELKLPKEMQMYSLRDSGIIDMQHSGIDQLTVQHHTDHSSLQVQRIYTDHYDPNVNDIIFKEAPDFSK